MALQKDTTIHGFIAKYWRILIIGFDSDHSRVEVKFVLYKDKGTRDADPNDYIDKKTVQWNAEDHSDILQTFKSTDKGIFSLIYTQAKQEFLTGAIDV